MINWQKSTKYECYNLLYNFIKIQLFSNFERIGRKLKEVLKNNQAVFFIWNHLLSVLNLQEKDLKTIL